MTADQEPDGRQFYRLRTPRVDGNSSAVTVRVTPGADLYLVLDGVLAVEVDGTRLGEVGPGAVLGERALLEGGRRTSTLTAVTPVRLAVAGHGAIDPEQLHALSQAHRRED